MKLDLRSLVLITVSTLGPSAPICAAATAVLDLDEAAAFLRVSPAAVERLARTDELPGRRIDGVWRFSRSAVLDWLGEVPVEAALPIDAIVGATIVGRGRDEATVEAPPAPRTTIGEARSAATADEVFLRNRRIGAGGRRATLELGGAYASNRSRALIDANGAELVDVESDLLTTFLLGRYRTSDDTEWFTGTSWQARRDAVFSGDDERIDRTRRELGEVSLGVRRTLLAEAVNRPQLVLGLNGFVPTGDTSKGIGASLAAIKSFDPAVLFATASYRYNFSPDADGLFVAEAEHELDVSAGIAFALNDTLTLGSALNGRFLGATDGRRQREQFALEFSLTTLIFPGLYVEPFLSFELDEVDDGFVFGVTVPYNFSRD